MFRGASELPVADIVSRRSEFRSEKLRAGPENGVAVTSGCKTIAGAIRKDAKGYYSGAAEGRCCRAGTRCRPQGPQASTRTPFQNAT